MGEYGVDYLIRLREAVEKFESAFEAWMQTQVESDHLLARGLLPTVGTKEDQDEVRVRSLELELARVSGSASAAVAVTGAHIAVRGIGPIDPIANWSLMSSPKALFAPRDIWMTASTVKGRLDAMIARAEATADSEVPTFAPARLHPVVWSAAAEHWTTHQYRVAVREAAEALTSHWRSRLRCHDLDGTRFWQQVLSPGDPTAGRPKLVWPGESADKTAKSMRGGLEPLSKALSQLATGLSLTVRNVTTHTRDELSEQEGMERLASYSYLARMLDQCEIRWAPENGGR